MYILDIVYNAGLHKRSNPDKLIHVHVIEQHI